MNSFITNALIVLCTGIFISHLLMGNRFFNMLAILLGACSILFLLVFSHIKNTKRYSCYILFVIVFLVGMISYRYAYLQQSQLDFMQGETAVFQCVISTDPIAKEQYSSYTAICNSVIFHGKNYSCHERIMIRDYGNALRQYGDEVQLTGEAETVSDIRNPGDFDYRLYYKSKHIFKTIKVNSTLNKGQNRAGAIATLLHHSKMHVKAVIYKALPHEQASILFGIIVGDKSEMDEAVVQDYTKTGLAHILSVSGLHVGFLVLLITILMRPLKLNSKIEGGIIVLVVLYYILMIGMPLPAVRAFIMLVILQFGKALGRKYNLLISVSFAAVFLLLLNPLSIWDPGFVISFACMFAIAALYEPIYKRINKVPLFLRSNLALSLSVWLGITPILIYYFNYVSVVSILLNLAAVPIAFAITLMGFIGVAAGSFSYVLSLYIFSTDYYLIIALTKLTEIFSKLPYCGFLIPRLPVYLNIAYYLVILSAVEWFGLKHYKYYKSKFIYATIAFAMLAVLIYNLPGSRLKIIFFDVGQGDSACLITPKKKVILLDGGGTASNLSQSYDIGERITVPALLHQGIWRIDTIIVSHIHEDHMQGLLAVLENFPVKRIVMPKTGYTSETYQQLVRKAEKKRIPIYYIQKGDRLKPEKGITLEALWPSNSLLTGTDSDVNNNSLVLKLNYKHFSALFTGDIENEAEACLKDFNLKVNVLKVAHHGSPYSSSAQFLNNARADYCIISVGRNSFGHPSAEAIDRMKTEKSRVLRTDQNGAVVVYTDGSSLRVKPVK